MVIVNGSEYMRYVKRTGLFCYKEVCLGTSCTLGALLNDDTEKALGSGASCTWKTYTIVTITFGSGTWF